MTTKTRLSIALLSCIPFVSSFSQDLELQAVAQTGTQFPGASVGEVLTLQEIDCWAQNETGRIVVGGRANSSISGAVSVVFTLENGVFQTQLQSGQPVTLFDVGVTWRSNARFASVAINDNDDLSVVGPIFDGVDEGTIVIKRIGAANSEILKTGDEAPGIAGSSISNIYTTQINSAGNVIVQMRVNDGVNSIDGFWLHKDGATTPFVYEGQPIAFDLKWFPLPIIHLPDSGDALFTAFIATGEASPPAGSGLYSKPLDGENDDFGQIRLSRNTVAPGSGGDETIEYPIYTAINQDRRVVFSSTIRLGGEGGADIGQRLFLGDLPASGSLENLSDVFDNSVNFPPAGSEVVSLLAVNLNDAGEIAFQTILDDFAEPFSIVFRHVNGVMETIVTEDQPLVVGATSLNPRAVLLESQSLNNDGELLFLVRDFDDDEFLLMASFVEPAIPIVPGDPIVPIVPVDPANPVDPNPVLPQLTVNGRATRDVSTPRVTLRGRIAIGASPIQTVKIKPRNRPFRNVKLNRSRTKWTAKVPLERGKNIIRIKATDLFGRDSAVARVRVNRR